MDGVGQARNRLALSIWCLLLFIPPASGADARGSMRLASCSFFKRYRLTLVGFQTQGSEKALEFNVPDESVLEREKDWIEVDATVERAGDSLRTLWAGQDSGVVAFNDGRKIEGDFSAKFAKPAAPQICE
jgi:hypothetical protein